MQARGGVGRKWRRFTRKHGVGFLVALLVIAAVAVVGFLMYVLTSPDWRWRW